MLVFAINDFLQNNSLPRKLNIGFLLLDVEASKKASIPNDTNYCFEHKKMNLSLLISRLLM